MPVPWATIEADPEFQALDADGQYDIASRWQEKKKAELPTEEHDAFLEASNNRLAPYFAPKAIQAAQFSQSLLGSPTSPLGAATALSSGELQVEKPPPLELAPAIPSIDQTMPPKVPTPAGFGPELAPIGGAGTVGELLTSAKEAVSTPPWQYLGIEKIPASIMLPGGQVVDLIFNSLGESKAAQVLQGLHKVGTNQIENLTNFMGSPLGVATMGLGSLGPTAQRIASLAFAADMASSQPALWERFQNAKTLREKTETLGDAVAGGLLTLTALKHGLTKVEKTAPVTPAEPPPLPSPTPETDAVLREISQPQPQQETPNATQTQRIGQSIRPEPQGGTQGGTPTEASLGDSLQRPAAGETAQEVIPTTEPAPVVQPGEVQVQPVPPPASEGQAKVEFVSREDGGVLAIAKIGDTEAGSAVISNLGNGNFELNEIRVNESQRRKGIGSQLYTEAANEVARRGGKLWTSPEQTESGKALTESLDKSGQLGDVTRIAGAHRREVKPTQPSPKEVTNVQEERRQTLQVAPTKAGVPSAAPEVAPRPAEAAAEGAPTAAPAGKPTVETEQGGVPYYRKLGEQDALDPTRKRMRSVPQNFKLAYQNGWYEAKKSKPADTATTPLEAAPAAETPEVEKQGGEAGGAVREITSEMSIAEKEEILAHLVRDRILVAPSFPKLLAAVKSFLKSVHGSIRPDFDASAREQPWNLLDQHAGVMNVTSARAKTLKSLADAVIREAKLPMNKAGMYRGQNYQINWDAIAAERKGSPTVSAETSTRAKHPGAPEAAARTTEAPAGNVAETQIPKGVLQAATSPDLHGTLPGELRMYSDAERAAIAKSIGVTETEPEALSQALIDKFAVNKTETKSPFPPGDLREKPPSEIDELIKSEEMERPLTRAANAAMSRISEADRSQRLGISPLSASRNDIPITEADLKSTSPDVEKRWQAAKVARKPFFEKVREKLWYNRTPAAN